MNILTMDGRFEWDSRKNKENMRKHNIRFAEILSVFDDPFRYKVISPFRVISPVEVMNNANGMRQVNGEGVVGQPAQPANDNQFPPGNGDGGFGPDQFPPGDGDGGVGPSQPGYPPQSPPPGSNQSQPFFSVKPLRAELYNSQNNANNNNQLAYDLPDDDEPYPELNSAELEEDANEVVEFAEAEQMARAYEDAGVEFSKEFTLERFKFHMERLKELCQTVEQTSPDVVAATLPKIYGPAVEIVEEAKTSSKEERGEIEDLLRDLIDEVDDKLDDAEPETKELHESIAQLSLDIATDQDQGKVEWDKTNVANQMKVVEDKVNETNERNAQILSGSSGQEVNPIKVEVKVDPLPGASSSEFMKGVSKANDDLIESQEVTNDYYASFATDENERKLFEDKNNVLNRSRKVHYSLGALPQHPPKSQGTRSGLIAPDSPRVLVGDNPPLPQKSRGTRFGLNPEELTPQDVAVLRRMDETRDPTTAPLNAEDLRSLNATHVPNSGPPRSISSRIKTTHPPLIVPNAQQGQTPTPVPAAPVETVQEPVHQDTPPERERKKTVVHQILFDGSHVALPDGLLDDMRERVKGLTRAAPMFYEQYKTYLRSQNLNEYFDENGECEYFYHRFQILSDVVPENIRISNNRSVPIPETIDNRLMNTINVAISLYLFNDIKLEIVESLTRFRNHFFSLIVLLNENEYLTDEYEEEERPVFFDEVRIGKLMEAYENRNHSRLSDFFAKLHRREFEKDEYDYDEPEVVRNIYDEIDEYIKRFKDYSDNLGTETYREYLDSVAKMTLAKFDEKDEIKFNANSNLNLSSDAISGFYPYQSGETDSVPSWLQEQYYDDYVRAYEDDDY